ncbi:MAG: peptidoglycan-binding protein [Myxococcota bacterium]
MLSIGSSGSSVRQLQQRLKAAGFNPGGVDGQFGARTQAAVRAYQRARRLEVDGKVGTQTMRALQRDGFEPSRHAGRTSTPSSTRTTETRASAGPTRSGANRTATFDAVSRTGQRNQMVTGRITVNGRTYTFRSGGHGRGNLPAGAYEVRPHLWSRNNRSMNVGGVGYSFALSDKYDSRVGGTRKLLRIHPDGGTAGTEGCIGIVGNAAVQRQFREDMRAELARNGGRFTLQVG